MSFTLRADETIAVKGGIKDPEVEQLRVGVTQPAMAEAALAFFTLMKGMQ